MVDKGEGKWSPSCISRELGFCQRTSFFPRIGEKFVYCRDRIHSESVQKDLIPGNGQYMSHLGPIRVSVRVC